MSLPIRREDQYQYDVTDSSWVLVLGISPEDFSFCSTDGSSGTHKMISVILHLILCMAFHGLGLLAVFVA
jgi:hypothetical protein